ncbi:MAG: hypothetical protein HQL67_06240 [Magnetococcales bacterium]|nr:hypothetical protein [Magnetococcales bacterium]
MKTPKSIPQQLALFLPINFTLVAAPFLQFVLYHDYPLITVEIGGNLILLFLLALFISGLTLFNRLLGLFFSAILLLFFVDFSWPVFVGVSGVLAVIQQTVLPQIWPLQALIEQNPSLPFFSLFLVCYLFLLLLKRGGWSVLQVVSVVLLLSTLIVGLTNPALMVAERSPAVVHSKGAPIIHIIFDQHIGLDGMLTDTPEARQAQREMTDFYDRFGFTLFSNAYARFGATKLSIPNSLNFDNGDYKNSRRYYDGIGEKLRKNRVFESMANAGYHIRSYHFEQIDYCDWNNDHTVFCKKRRNNSIGLMASWPWPVSWKFQLILKNFLAKSTLAKTLNPAMAKQFDPESRLGRFFVGQRFDQFLGGGAVQDEENWLWLQADVKKYPQGSAFFMHYLMPHPPYSLDEQCRFIPDFIVKKYQGTAEQIVQQKSRDYYGQLRCLYKKLNRWMAELEQEPHWDQMTIVFHGDHGTRFSRRRPEFLRKGEATVPGQSIEPILRDWYSALFAIKHAKVAPGVVNLAKPLDRLLQESYLNPQQLWEPTPAPDQFVFSNRVGSQKIFVNSDHSQGPFYRVNPALPQEGGL